MHWIIGFKTAVFFKSVYYTVIRSVTEIYNVH
jgi:hypothetical protein